MPASKQSAAGLSFDARLYAFRRGKKFPRLTQGEVSQDVYLNAKHFVVVDVGPLETTLEALDPPPPVDAWRQVEASASPLLTRLDEEDVDLLFRGRSPAVKRPADYQDVAPREPTLDERRALPEHKLIVPKVLRPR